MAAVAKERKTLVDKIGRKRARGLKYLLIAVPFMIYVFAFSYVPLIGWVYSIFEYKIGQRFLDFGNMVFIGLDNFKKLYQERSEVLRVMRNTLVMSSLGLLATPVPVIFAIMFNEIRSKRFKKLVQTATTLPNFISWIIVYGIAFIIVEKLHKGKEFKINDISSITFKTAALIGIFQVLALIPGTSRSGATIVGAMIIGVGRTAAAEFTFYLAIPVMFGASLLKLIKFGFAFTAAEAAALILGMVAAFVVSIIAIRFLMGYIKKHDFTVFGWYRIILGILVLVMMFLR